MDNASLYAPVLVVGDGTDQRADERTSVQTLKTRAKHARILHEQM